MQLKEVNAIVTGGASGLGLAVATRIVHGGGKASHFRSEHCAGQRCRGGARP